VFNENDDLQTVNVTSDLPGLQLEGGSGPDVDLQTPENLERRSEPQDSPQTSTPLTGEAGPSAPAPYTRPSRAVDRDYRQLNNPLARPTTRAIREPLDARRPTESSTAKQKEKVSAEAHIAYAYLSAMNAEVGIAEKDPWDLKEAREAADWDKWEVAIKEELDQLEEMKAWDLVDLPEDQEPIGCKWVFLRKRDENGTVIRHKACLVAQGYAQKPGVDYSETGTFAPVMRFDTLRTLFALAAVHDWEVLQLDIKGAYLNGIVKEELYMKQPTGYEDGTGRICKLFKTLYGLKQAGNEWNTELHGSMLEFEYTRLRSNYGVYYSRSGNTFPIVLIWVDDITIFGDSAATNKELVKKLKEKYDVKVIGEPTLLLGIHIERDRANRTITLSQKRYITKILERAGMSESKPVHTPMDPNVALVANTDENNENEAGRTSIEYATRIGELLYAAHATRPDILYATTTLAQFTSNPAQEHWTAVKRVFRYLKGTINHGLTY
jgi:Reverse transcriptase (RNA-dependent DNA polymerase)